MYCRELSYPSVSQGSVIWIRQPGALSGVTGFVTKEQLSGIKLWEAGHPPPPPSRRRHATYIRWPEAGRCPLVVRVWSFYKSTTSSSERDFAAPRGGRGPDKGPCLICRVGTGRAGRHHEDVSDLQRTPRRSNDDGGSMGPWALRPSYCLLLACIFLLIAHQNSE